MSLFIFAPFLLRLESPAVIRCLRPVQLPFQVLLFGDFPAAKLLLSEHLLGHKAIEDVAIKAERNALAGKLFIRVMPVILPDFIASECVLNHKGMIGINNINCATEVLLPSFFNSFRAYPGRSLSVLPYFTRTRVLPLLKNIFSG